MRNDQPTTVVLAFLDAINSGDVNRLCALMTEDHLFVDALGNKVQGKESMRKAWAGYFQLFPDYRVSHAEILSDGKLVAAFGSAEGTYALNGKTHKKQSLGGARSVESRGAGWPGQRMARVRGQSGRQENHESA